MATNPFAGFTPGQAMTPEVAQFLANWKANRIADLRANAGNTEFSPGSFSESYYDPGTGYAFTPESGTDGWLAYDWSGARESKDKSLLNGRTQYNYDAGGALRNQGTIRGLSKTGEFGPLAQALGIAIGGPIAGSFMGGINPVLAAEGAGAIGGSAGTGALAGGAAGDALGGVSVGGPMSTGMPVGAELGTLGEIGAGAIPEGMAFAPATAAEMAAMGVGGAGTAAMGAGAAGAAAAGGSQGFNWGSLIGPATQLVGGALGANAASNAADAQLQAAREAQALSEPFRQGGMAGMNRLLDLLGLSQNTGAAGYGSLMKDFSAADFQADPGYAFRQAEGERGLTRAASASGLLGSGKYLKDATRFNQDLASQEYGNAFNRFQTNRANKLNPLQSLMGAGQTAAGTVGDFATQAGDARAAGSVGRANAWTDAIGQGVSMYQRSREADQNKLYQNAMMDFWKRGA